MTTTTIDDSKRKRSGGDRRARYAALPPEELRRHCVSVRLNDDELRQLDEQRASVQMQRGEYFRAAALHQLPPTIPAINRSAYLELTRIGANLNQLAKRANSGDLPELDQLRGQLDALRLTLITVVEGEGDT